MSTVLKVENLVKKYRTFELKNVSFSVQSGSIMGFIGRNGAGKTTTLKSILNLVHKESGKIEFFGMDSDSNEKEIKQRIGYASGGNHYYGHKKLKDIVKITKRFYSSWDNEAYNKYIKKFSLDENKNAIELSEGMKVKFHLTLALSHHAELLILDEPTSGLDPVSRDDLLEVFLELAQNGAAILFSTHITSDLDKCADYITYIKDGAIIASQSTDDFVGKYRIIESDKNTITSENNKILGICRSRTSSTALINSSDAESFENCTIRKPDLEEVMLHLEKETE